MTPDSLRAWITVLVRDLLGGGTGIFLAIYLPVTHQLEPWHLPLIAGLIGVTLAGRSQDET